MMLTPEQVKGRIKSMALKNRADARTLMLYISYPLSKTMSIYMVSGKVIRASIPMRQKSVMKTLSVVRKLL